MERAVVLLVVSMSILAQAATVSLDGRTVYQSIDGFGVNANHRSWNNDELKPVLDALIDDAGMTLFRVIFDNTDWEATNDNADPATMDWTYYNAIYSSNTFGPMWEMMAYLNQRGITNGAHFCFMGPGPPWLGGGTLSAGMEREWAEQIASLLVYARKVAGLQFQYVAPDNESDILKEGIHVNDANQYTTALHRLAELLDANGLSDVQFVAPDLAGGGTTFLPQLLADPVVMAKLAHFGVHSYSSGGAGSAGVYDFIRASAYPNRNFWVTEYNVWCTTCDSGTRGTYDWAFCKGTAEYLLSHLLNNASAGIVYEGYDSFYAHHAAWGYWGLFSVDNENATVKTYTPRKNFYTLAQVSRFVRPGAQRIAVSGSASPFSPLLAFKHTALGHVALVGLNTSSGTASLAASLTALPAVPYLDLYYTSARTNLAYGGRFALNNQAFSATIPADCVFTLFGVAGLQVSLTSPADGARFNAPALIPVAAQTSGGAGAVSLVEFYAGLSKLGEARSAPFQWTWNDAPMGDYTLSARATDTGGILATSALVRVSVAGPVAQIALTPSNAVVGAGNSLPFTATASDLLGHVLSPQPTLAWAASGGGTINNSGLFTAASAAGGPYTITAANSGVTGVASVTVTALPDGTFGNTKDGTAVDTIYDKGAWINCSRFLAGSNLVVSTLRAKVGAIAGGYKCAVYADQSSRPSALLGSSVEVRNPTNGWNVFPLAAPISLTKGLYYWLAIWSDDANAKVYYSDTSGTLRWGRYDYGTWPNPVSTSGGANHSYCLAATGSRTAPALASIAVTPANLSLANGTTRQLSATGSYIDGSTQDVTSQIAWTSSAPSVASITAGGQVSALSPGSTTISATLAGVTGTTTVTVTAPALTIATASLPGGVVNSAYTASLTASGGTAPYAWAVSSGALPNGLTLNPGNGNLAGTPTASGTFTFTLQVSDSSHPTRSTTKGFSVTISPSVASLWPSNTVPVLVDGGPDSSVELGVKFRSDVAGTILAIRFYKATANTGTHTANLWTSTGTRLATATFSGETRSGWQQVNFSTPVTISANTVYVASYHANNGHYSVDRDYFANRAVDNPPLHALANGTNGGNGVYAYGRNSLFPNQTWYAANYWVDVVFRPASATSVTTASAAP